MKKTLILISSILFSACSHYVLPEKGVATKIRYSFGHQRVTIKTVAGHRYLTYVPINEAVMVGDTFEVSRKFAVQRSNGIAKTFLNGNEPLGATSLKKLPR